MRRRILVPLGKCALLALVPAGVVYARDYAIDWHTIDGGGDVDQADFAAFQTVLQRAGCSRRAGLR